MPKLVIGEIVAGMQILELLRDHPRVNSRLYAVKYVCCGEESEVTLAAINLRKSKRRVLCMKCAIKSRSKPSVVHRVKRDSQGEWDPLDYSYPRDLPQYGVTPPTWPVPDGVLEMLRQ